jgi:hypothetical protein
VAYGLAAVALAIVVLVRAPHAAGEDLLLRPDALDYAIVAHRLSDGEQPGLPLGGHLYPSRYPLGFPLLLAPAVRAGTRPDSLWHVTALLAVAGVALTYLAGLLVAAPLEALWGAALLGCSPLYVRFATMTMSDVPATACAAAWLLLLAMPFTAALGMVSGFACSIRLMCLPLVVGGAVAAVARGRRDLACFVAGLALGLGPVIVSAVARSAGPLAGYGFWLPDEYGSLGATFQLSALRANVAEYVAALVGIARDGPFYSFLVPALATLGAWTAWNRREASRRVLGIAAAAVIMYYGIALFYFFHDLRLLLPVVPLVIVAAVSGLHCLAIRRPVIAGILAIVALTIQTNAVVRSMRADRGYATVAPTLTAVSERLPRDGLVVSDVSFGLAWLYWIRGTARDFIPLLVPPLSQRVTPYTDRLVSRLAWNAARGHGDAPETFLGADGRASGAAWAALDRTARAADLITIVTCTKWGRAAILDAAKGLRFSPPAAVAGCDVLTVIGRQTVAQGVRLP